MENVFYLYPSCITTKGGCRSLIIDTQRGQYKLIPNILHKIIEKYQGFSIDYIKQEEGIEHSDIIDEYFDFLLQNDLIFFSSNTVAFNPQYLKIETPNVVSNAFIEVNQDFPYDTIKELSDLNCTILHIKFTSVISVEFLKRILSIIDKSRISSVQITMTYSSDFERNIENVLCQSVKLKRILVIDSPYNKEHSYGLNNKYFIFYIDKASSKQLQCGCIHPNFFTTSKGMVIESKTRNSCFNKKIFIDRKGFVRNCPYSHQIIGDLKKESIVEVVKKENYQLLCSITKDQIEVCKDCEFSLICMDCRVFIKDKNNIYSQPAKCNYNPYIAKWQGQEGWISVEQWRAENTDWEEKAIQNRTHQQKKPQTV